MKTNKKIVIEVIWRPTDRMQNADMVADRLSDVVAKWFADEDIDGAAFALSVVR